VINIFILDSAEFFIFIRLVGHLRIYMSFDVYLGVLVGVLHFFELILLTPIEVITLSAVDSSVSAYECVYRWKDRRSE